MAEDAISRRKRKRDPEDEEADQDGTENGPGTVQQENAKKNQTKQNKRAAISTAIGAATSSFTLPYLLSFSRVCVCACVCVSVCVCRRRRMIGFESDYHRDEREIGGGVYH